MKRKQCIRCGMVLPLSKFYRHPAMADGRLGRCKECHKAEARRVRFNNAIRYRTYDRERNKTPERRAMFAAKQRRTRAAHPEHDVAYRAVRVAIASGKLVRPACCEACGASGRLHAHHDDHKRKLTVAWLCPVCHAQRHQAKS